MAQNYTTDGTKYWLKIYSKTHITGLIADKCHKPHFSPPLLKVERFVGCYYSRRTIFSGVTAPTEKLNKIRQY